MIRRPVIQNIRDACKSEKVFVYLVKPITVIETWPAPANITLTQQLKSYLYLARIPIQYPVKGTGHTVLVCRPKKGMRRLTVAQFWCAVPTMKRNVVAVAQFSCVVPTKGRDVVTVGQVLCAAQTRGRDIAAVAQFLRTFPTKGRGVVVVTQFLSA